MKKLALLGALSALAASALPGAAAAAQISGVVVAKDQARRAVVVVSHGQVRTVRTARFARIELAQRVLATGSRLRDGSFAARSIRVTGRSRQVRFDAVVVRHEAARQRLILSAGGSVFALRLTAGRSFATDGSGLAPGDRVKVSADVRKDGLGAGRGDVKETGHVELMKLEGIFLRGGREGFDIAVVRRGLVHIRHKAGAELPEWEPGDVILVVVSVGPDGFTYVGGHTDGKPGGDKPDGDGKNRGDDKPTDAKSDVEVAGKLVERSAAQVGVKREDGTTVTCAVPAGLELSLFRIGEHVKMFCKKRDTGLVLSWLKSERAMVKDDGRGEAWFSGILADGPGVSVKLEDGSLVTCPPEKPVDLSAFKAGDKVKLTCVLVGGKLRFGSLKSEFASVNADGSEVGAYGVLTAASGGTVSVARDGASFSCALPAAVDLSAVALGQKASLACARRDGVLTFASLSAGELWLKADGSGERTVYGTFLERGVETVTVKREDGSTFSCAAPAAIDLSGFKAGDKVKQRCRLKEGQWRLSLMRSDTATVEVPL